MADDKLRQELFYMVKLANKYDFSDMDVVEGILRLENERKILTSVFGARFKTRIFDIAAGIGNDDKCVICGNVAENKVICKHCMDSVLDSEYAKNKIKNKQKEGKKLFSIPFHFDVKGIKNIKINWKRTGQYFIIFCLIMILLVQATLLYMWVSLPTYNSKQKAIVSEYQEEPVSDQNQAYEKLLMDFPEELGYSVTYMRQDKEFVGRFLLDVGACCEETEEKLTDEERYDYFFQEDVYVFYITNISDYSAMLGIAEVNKSGAVLLTGSFNDGRKTDLWYKIR